MGAEGKTWNRVLEAGIGLAKGISNLAVDLYRLFKFQYQAPIPPYPYPPPPPRPYYRYPPAPPRAVDRIDGGDEIQNKMVMYVEHIEEKKLSASELFKESVKDALKDVWYYIRKVAKLPKKIYRKLFGRPTPVYYYPPPPPQQGY